MQVECIAEPTPGPIWTSVFARFWPGYRSWYLKDEAARPPAAECRTALAQHMPELVATYDRLLGLAAPIAGEAETPARMLSLWRPPAFMSGCSQAIWTRGPGPGPLLRSYDYSPDLFEGVVLRTAWARPVLGMSDCLWGLLDGVNDAGLCIALAFGGRDAIGPGFGIPLIVRYLLETCTTTAGASAALRRLPVHMAYNIALVDATGDHAIAQVGPDRPALIRRDQVCANHQEPEPSDKADQQSQPRQRSGAGEPPAVPPSAVESKAASAFAKRYAKATATHERERTLRQLLADSRQTPESMAKAYARPPLFSRAYAKGWGTLYMAAYDPATRGVMLRWPDKSVTTQTLGNFIPVQIRVELP